MELRPIQAGGHLNAMLFQKKIQKRNKLVQLICGTFFPVVSQHDIVSVMAVFFPYLPFQISLHRVLRKMRLLPRLTHDS